MREHLYTVEERIFQLQSLRNALTSLVRHLEAVEDLPCQLVAYHAVLEKAAELLERGFTMEEITELGRSVPDLFYRYREWEPPAELLPDGTYHDAAWFKELEVRLQPALKAAGQLASIGCY